MEAEHQRVIILGSTGSIGTQALDVINRHRDRFEVAGLAAGGSHVELLAEQAASFHVPLVVVSNPQAEEPLRQALDAKGAHATQIRSGQDEVVALAGAGASVVLNGITGSIGLEPSIAALQADSQLALANKESVVAGGHLLFDAQTREHQINPVDSEHSAIWQSLRAGTHAEVSKLIVTASGGPFRGWTREQMESVTPQQALNHPTWNMGPVVTINSSTLMNKGLEVIEAHHLFDMPYDRIKVVVQPQSAIHSMVEYSDGSVKAHLGTTDMRIPIQFALSYPDRWDAPVEPLDFTQLGKLEFYPVDEDTFRCFKLAKYAGDTGGTLPCVMNAANEVAVAAFLRDACGYLDIDGCVGAMMEAHEAGQGGGLQKVESLDQLAEIDAWAREASAAWLAARAK